VKTDYTRRCRALLHTLWLCTALDCAALHRIQEVRVEETSGYNPNFFTSLDAEKYQVGGNKQALQPPTLKAAIVNRRISLPTVSCDE
jgi:hypothetical protein